MQSRVVVGVVGAVTLAAAGCRSAIESSTDGVCTSNAPPGIVLAVQDSVAGTPALAGAIITVREGAYLAAVRGPEASPANAKIGLVSERAGTYTVSVAQAGYRPWERSGVRVTADECHVRTVALTAYLQR